MRRNLFVMALMVTAMVAVDTTFVVKATAQNCCVRRPLIGRTCATGCCNQVSITTQTQEMMGVAPWTVQNVAAIPAATPSPLNCGAVETSWTTPVISQFPTDISATIPLASTAQPSVVGYATPVNAPVTNQLAPQISGIAVAQTTGQSFSNACPSCSYATQPSYVMPTFTQTSMRVSQQVAGGLAQRKAQRAAQMGVRGHLGGSLGGARYEGVGWSSVSPRQAIQSCCYWGQRNPMDIGVARSSDGLWYACVLYR